MIDPSCVEAHYNLGMAWARQNRLDEAIPEYEQTLKIDPDCAEAHANLGVALQLRGRIGDAAAHFQKALVLATQQNKQQLAENLKARLRQIAE
jgi:Flp pilus assembly protein TadD